MQSLAELQHDLPDGGLGQRQLAGRCGTDEAREVPRWGVLHHDAQLGTWGGGGQGVGGEMAPRSAPQPRRTAPGGLTRQEGLVVTDHVGVIQAAQQADLIHRVCALALAHGAEVCLLHRVHLAICKSLDLVHRAIGPTPECLEHLRRRDGEP